MTIARTQATAAGSGGLHPDVLAFSSSLSLDRALWREDLLGSLAHLSMLAKTGLIAMIGKAERGPVAIDAIRRHRAAYLMAVGGAAYLVSKAIRRSRVVAFADLGMEAIYEFEVADMPVTVAVDATGESVHETGPREWRRKIGRIRATPA